MSPHVPVGIVTCPLLWAAALAAAQPCGVSPTTGGIAPASLRYNHLTPVARAAGPAAWQAAPSWAVCPHGCHRLLPWLWVTFAMVPHAAWTGSHQWPWSTAPAIGPAGQLGRSSASNPGAVVRGALSLCCPRCVCVCGVLAHLAPVHRCARFLCSVRPVRIHLALVQRSPRCVRYVFVGGGFVGDPNLLRFLVFFLFFLVPSSFCVCSVFVFSFFFLRLLILLCFFCPFF